MGQCGDRNAIAPLPHCPIASLPRCQTAHLQLVSNFPMSRYVVALAALLVMPVAAWQGRGVLPTAPPPTGPMGRPPVVGTGVLLGQVVDAQGGGAIPAAIVSLNGGI